MPTPALDPALLEEAARLVRVEGLSQRAAARQTGICQSSISGFLNSPTLRGNASEIAPDLGGDPSPGYIEVPVVHRDYSHLDALHLYSLGDVHKGARSHDAAKWREWLAYLEHRDDASVILTGDLLNCALKDSKSDVYEENMTVGEAKRELTRELEPLARAGRVDVAVQGNHEARVSRAIGACPVEDIAHFLDFPYQKDAVLLVYKVGQVEYQVFLRHGTGGGQIGARANRLQKQAMTIWADIYISGHSHSQSAFVEEVFAYSPEAQRVQRHRRLFVASGSFLRYESYAAAAGYSPGKMGAPRVRLDGIRKDAHVSI